MEANNDDEVVFEENRNQTPIPPYPIPTECIPSVNHILSGPPVFHQYETETPSPSPVESSVALGVNACSTVIMDSLRRGCGVLCVPVADDGTPNGRGVRVHANGNFIEGQFESLDCIRDAKMRTPHAEYYMKGSIVRGAMDGEVEISLPNVGRFVGTMAHGKPHGMGIWVRGDGTWYEGAWDDGERHGTGNEHYSDDVVYSGGWCRDLYDGPGELRSRDSRFKGSWRRGTRTGIGTLVEDCTVAQSFEVEYGQDGNEVRRMTTDAVEIQNLRRKVEDLVNMRTGAVVPISISDMDVDNAQEECTLSNTQPESQGSVGGEATNATLCKVCFVEPISRVLRPCNHACLCAACETHMKLTQDQSTLHARFGRIRCPICRSMSRSSDVVILS